MSRVDAGGKVHCDNCRALCCRLLVVLDGDDAIPQHLTTVTDTGLHVMARGEDGFCVALGADDRCRIYATRPATCRRFVMAGAYCRAVREDAARRTPEDDDEQRPSCTS